MSYAVGREELLAGGEWVRGVCNDVLMGGVGVGEGVAVLLLILGSDWSTERSLLLV